MHIHVLIHLDEHIIVLIMFFVSKHEVHQLFHQGYSHGRPIFHGYITLG
jgi:hypothetical protein